MLAAKVLLLSSRRRKLGKRPTFKLATSKAIRMRIFAVAKAKGERVADPDLH
jgi:hypothetical protein